MSNFVLLIAALAVVGMVAAQGGDYKLGQVHLLEKSYWYECNNEGANCEFKKCIVEYNQAGKGPEKCITPENLYKFHKEQNTPVDLEQRNCYDIRKIHYDREYKDQANKYITDCIRDDEVSAGLNVNQKPVCNLVGKTATHYYDYGFYKCMNNEDFILQGCEFAETNSKKCLSYTATQNEVNADSTNTLQNILKDIDQQLENGQTPRTACYLLGQTDHFKTFDNKESCDFVIQNPSEDLKKAVEAAKKADTTAAPTTTTTTTTKPTTTTTAGTSTSDSSTSPSTTASTTVAPPSPVTVFVPKEKDRKDFEQKVTKAPLPTNDDDY